MSHDVACQSAVDQRLQETARRFEDFYDDRFLEELDASGFIDETSAPVKAAR